MRGGKGEQKSSETLGLLHLFSVFIHWVTVLFKKSFWKMLQHFLFFAKLRSARGPPASCGQKRPPRRGGRFKKFPSSKMGAKRNEVNL